MSDTQDPLIKENGPAPTRSYDIKPIKSTSEATENDSRVRTRRPWRRVVVEPIMLLYCLAQDGNGPLLEQYIYSRFKRGFPILDNVSHADTGSDCHDINTTDPVYIATQSVQSETSRLQMFMSVSSLLTIITALIYGAFADIKGRKPILFLPCLAAAGKFTMNSLIVYFDWPIYMVLIGQVIDGLCGGYSTFLVAVYAYLADTTTPDDRGMRIVLADAIMAIAIAVSNLVVGYALDNIGFLYTYVILICLIALAIIGVIFFVPETMDKDKQNRNTFSLWVSVKTIYSIFTDKHNSRHIKIFLIILAFFLCNIPLDSRSSIQLLFVMNIPLCWGPVMIGIYFGVSGLATEISGVVAAKLFKMCRFPEIWIAAIGVGSVIASALVNAWANSIFLMIMGK
jgi:PCFT/HCP family folate transporter-like MFS transporter 1/3